MATAAVDRQAPGLLYALRLVPASSPGRLQGEVEHVVTGERCRFLGAAELVAWLQARHAGIEAAAALQPGEGEAPGSAPRRATT